MKEKLTTPDAPLTLADIAEPRRQDATLGFAIRRACRTLWHRLLPREMPRYVTRGGIRYMLNVNELMHRHLLGKGHFEREAIVHFFNAAKARGADVFLDIGANMGYYSLLAARLGIFGEIHAFEPHPETYKRLLWHVGANNFGDVITPHNVAASDAARMMRMRELGGKSDGDILQVFGDKPPTAPDNTPETMRMLYTAQAGGTVDIAAKPLDSVFAFRGRNICMKIDVEGHEAEVLNGAENLLRHNNVLMQIEIWPWQLDVIGGITARGYSPTQRINNDFYFVNKRPDGAGVCSTG